MIVIAMATYPSQAVMNSWMTIADVRAWAKISDEEWLKVSTAMGEPGFDDLYTLAGLDDEDFVKARTEAALPMLRRAALNFMFGAKKYKFGVVTTIIKTEAVPVPATSLSASTSVAAAGAAATGSTATMPGDPSQLTAKVRLGQVLDQALDQEVPMLTIAELDELRAVYVDKEGDEPLRTCAPSNAQLTAMKFAVNAGLAPYANFGVFGQHGTRIERRMKFTHHH